MLRSLACIAALSLLSACGVDDVSTGDEADLKAASGDFTVSINVVPTTGGHARIHGLANHPLERAFAFIPDDEVGSTHTAPKSFTSSFGGGEVQLFLGGRPAFFSMSTTDIGAFTARADLGVKMHIDSPVDIKVASAADSVLVGGTPFIRLKGTFTDPLVEAKAVADGVDVPAVVDGKAWRVDLPLGFMGETLASGQAIPILLTTQFDDFSGEVDASLKIKKVDLTTDDAYDVWPTPACSAKVLACIQLPANAVDTAACGDAFVVGPCWHQLHP